MTIHTCVYIYVDFYINSIVSYYAILYCIVLYYIRFHCFILYLIGLYDSNQKHNLREFATAYFRHPGYLRVLPGLCRRVSASPPEAPEASRAARTFEVFRLCLAPKKNTFWTETL